MLVVALIVLGPARLPDAARSLGKAVNELRRVTSGVQAEVRDAFAEPPPSFPRPQEPSATDVPPTSTLPAPGPEQDEVVVVREPDPPGPS